jgi:TrwC relaxase
VTTLSELYDGALADLLTAALAVGWEERERRHSTRARFEVTGVPEALMAEFSQRLGQVAAEVTGLQAQSEAAHGGAPPPSRTCACTRWPRSPPARPSPVPAWPN